MNLLRDSFMRDRDIDPSLTFSPILIPNVLIPHMPDSYEIVSHYDTPKISFPDGVDLLLSEFYLSDVIDSATCMLGKDLYGKLHNNQSLNINALAEILQNQSLIPEFWKKDWKDDARTILFWGTVYKIPSGEVCVKGLHWNHRKWCVDDFSIEGHFNNCFAAAVKKLDS